MEVEAAELEERNSDEEDAAIDHSPCFQQSCFVTVCFPQTLSQRLPFVVPSIIAPKSIAGWSRCSFMRLYWVDGLIFKRNDGFTLTLLLVAGISCSISSQAKMKADSRIRYWSCRSKETVMRIVYILKASAAIDKDMIVGRMEAHRAVDMEAAVVHARVHTLAARLMRRGEAGD
jgi:hypothetical protein